MQTSNLNSLTRCSWCGDTPDYVAYHDHIWGVPEYNSHQLFAKLVLDGQQAGLSWITILRKQKNYEAAFFGLNPERLAALQGRAREEHIAEQLNNAGIIRNKLKVNSVFKNADAYMKLEAAGINFSELLWSYVGGRPLQNSWQSMGDVPTETEASRALSKRLKKAGFNFVGPTIVYAFMQAVGMVNDHLVDCFRYNEHIKK